MPNATRNANSSGTTVQKLVQAWLSIDDGTTEATREFRYKSTRALITMWARRHVSGLTVADAKAIAGKIRAEYASKTAARRLSTIKQWGQWLVDTEILEVNPFAVIKAGSGKVNSTSKRFVSLEEFYGVLKTVKDLEWRVLLVLARFCGLRIPSEVYDLTWSDVLFDDNPPRLRIDKHKTEDRFCRQGDPGCRIKN
jgi:integrase